MERAAQLTIFHYHLLTGGVATVVRQALGAFRQHLPELGTIRLVAGRIPQEFRRAVEQLEVSCEVFPQIDYRAAGRGRPAQQGLRLAQRLLDSFASRDGVWWVHNHHLGKNPVFTQALLHIAGSASAQRLILQIHDFPECGRFQNLRLLRRTLSQPPYPLGPRVRYALLNSRDLNILSAAGVPAAAAHLLENPLPSFSGSRSPREQSEVKARLARSFAREFPRFDPQAPLLFYPVRTIRRKNALEAILIAVLLGEEANLLITLPGISAPERRYSDLVRTLFAEGLIPGLWGIGARLEQAGLSFDDLAGASDVVLSTSVQEGFGYLFINALQWRRPLAARRLDVLEGLSGLFVDYPACFYRSLVVGLPNREVGELRSRYEAKLASLSDILPVHVRSGLLAESRSLGREGMVDFSFLPVELQESLLRRILRGEDLEATRAANGDLLDSLRGLLGLSPAVIQDKSGQVQQRFGLSSYAAAFKRILDSFPAEPGRADRPESLSPACADQEAVIRGFALLDYLRLLYDFT